MHPFAFATLAIVLSGAASWSWFLAAIALLARLGLKVRADRALCHTDRGPWLLPVWDIALFLVFLASYSSTRVAWRGLHFSRGPERHATFIRTRIGQPEPPGSPRGHSCRAGTDLIERGLGGLSPTVRRVSVVKTLLLFVLAAVAEIGGAWLIWQGVREHRGLVWMGAWVLLAEHDREQWWDDDQPAGQAR